MTDLRIFSKDHPRQSPELDASDPRILTKTKPEVSQNDHDIMVSIKFDGEYDRDRSWGEPGEFDIVFGVLAMIFCGCLLTMFGIIVWLSIEKIFL